MTELHDLAASLGVDERTLRRSVSRGLIRARRPSQRRLELPFAERRYVETHWPLFSQLLQVLRTRHDVRLAVLYGSTARGEENARSDVDMLVSFRDEDVGSAASLAGTLSEQVGRAVQVTALPVARNAPLLLRDVLRDGRVLVDRDGEWSRLKRSAPRVERDASAAENELDARLAELAELVRK